MHNKRAVARLKAVPTHFSTPHRLGDLLVHTGLINQAQLNTALQEQCQTGEALGQILLRHGLITIGQLRYKLLKQTCYRVAAAVLGFVVSVAATPSFAQTRGLNSDNQTATASGDIITIAAVSPGSFFDVDDKRYSSTGSLASWSSLEARASTRDNNCTQQGEFCLPNEWQAFAEKISHLSSGQKIAAVHDFINKYRFISDRDNYGQRDYWATPAEFVARQGGDCEDYSIAKMALLEAAGFERDNMRILVLNETVQQFRHAVLLVNDNGGWVVLDNMQKTVKRPDQLPRYAPIYSVNFNAWWLHNLPYAAM